jgi:hypothetical protein
MPHEALATYLQDHLAGSVAALDLLAHLTTDGAASAPMLARLAADIEADQEALVALMTRLQIAPSRPREVAAWLTAKLGEIRLQLEAGDDLALRALEGLEALELGIAGKEALWQALAAVADQTPDLGAMDYPGLIERARDQRQQVETLRLAAARTALGPERAGPG